MMIFTQVLFLQSIDITKVVYMQHCLSETVFIQNIYHLINTHSTDIAANLVGCSPHLTNLFIYAHAIGDCANACGVCFDYVAILRDLTSQWLPSMLTCSS